MAGGPACLSQSAAHIGDVAPFVTLEIVQPTERSMAQMERGEIDILLMPERYLSRSYPSDPAHVWLRSMLRHAAGGHADT